MSIRNALAAISAIACLFGVNAMAATGRTAGQFAVSRFGGAQYTIPISVPPGPRGVQPRLSLHYDSQSPIGPLGVGWSVTGLGSIARCNRTGGDDLILAAVTLSTSDGYCINGNRLKLTSGTYGADASTYQTSIADFSNITMHGTQGSGPAYFTVQGRDGLIYQYGFVDSNGNGANSQIIATGTTTASAWLLSKVSDRPGNNFVVNYLAPSLSGTILTGTSVPAAILWTPTSAGASTYAYKMQFNYIANVPQGSATGFVAGTLVEDQELLSSVEIFSGGTVIKDYFLGYQLSPVSGRKQLITMQECADSGQSNCLAPTTVGYQGGTNGVSTSLSTALSASGAQLTTRYDFNGDGFPDIAYWNSSTNTMYVAFGSPSGYGTPVNTGATPGTFGALVGKLKGGAQDGFLAVVSGTWWSYMWNGSGFVPSSTGIATGGSATQYQLADINGDGLPDLIEMDQTLNSFTHKYITTIYTRLNNTSSGGALSFSSTITTAYSALVSVPATLLSPDRQYGKVRRYDFNGDGMDDLVLLTITGTSPNYTLSTYELISNGSTFTGKLIATAANGSYVPVFFTDWNDDKCTDFVTSNNLYVAGCNGTAAQTYSVPGTILVALDWDGDGRTDLLVANGSTIGVYLSKATGAPTLTTTSVPYSASCLYVWIDANGDNLDDLGCQTGPLSYFSHNGTVDLATSFADGYGVTYSPSYVSLAASGGAYIPGSGALLPSQNYTGPLEIVSSYASSDGIGGSYTTSYVYTNAVNDLLGHGFQGFAQIQSHDSRNLTYETINYSTDFLSSGIITSDVITQSNSKIIRSLTSSVVTEVLNSTFPNTRSFSYANPVTLKQYEVGGSDDGLLMSTTVTTYSSPDGYGNFGTVATSITDNDPNTIYPGEQWTSSVATTISADSSSNWCLTLPTEVDTTNTGPGVPSRTRHVSYVLPDYVNCRQTDQVVESGNATYQVDTKYGYDPSFGTLTSLTITGASMAPRVTSISWNTTGQFPTSVTNPMYPVGNPLAQTTQYNFDPITGKPLRVTDPNGIPTSWSYDPFGREALESRPDGTSTTWAYNSCVTAGCVNSNNTTTVVQTNLKTNGSTLNVQNTYLDSFGRILVKSKQMLNGAFDRREVQYDSLGRVHLQGMPCTFISCTQYWTTNSYDILNRMTQKQRPISATIPTLQTTKYDYQGRTTTITYPPTTANPTGRVRTKIDHVNGVLGRTIDGSYNVNFLYDAFGSLLSVTDSLSNPLRTMTYDYGIRAFRKSMTDADLGTGWTWTYDALGEVTARSDAKGQSFAQTYDALSRPLVRTEPAASPDLTTTWTWGTSAANANIGKLQSLASLDSIGTYSESYGYDGVGRVSTETVVIPMDSTYTYTKTYNSLTGLSDTLQYPVSTSSYLLKIQYGYSYGVLNTISDINTGIPYWTANTIIPRGQITQETLGNGVVVAHDFDAVTGWPNSIKAGLGGGNGLQNNAYSFDDVGNLIQRQDNNQGITENFSYDALDRFSSSTLNTAADESRAYDGTGNVLTWSVFGASLNTMNYTTPQPGCTYYPNSQPHAVRSNTQGSFVNSLCYDANGNMTSGSLGFSATWTSYNQPSFINGGFGGSSNFYYNGHHQRYKQVANASGAITTTYYIGNLLEKVSSSSGTSYRQYIPAGNNTVLSTVLASSGIGSTNYLTKDHLGSTDVITDSTGALVFGENFSVFGILRASNWTGSGTIPNIASVSQRAFTGQEMLRNIGGVDLNGRVLDNSTGRMLSPDPFTGHRANTQSWNRYGYVTNNPLKYVDPSGFLLVCTFTDAVGEAQIAQIECDDVPDPPPPPPPLPTFTFQPGPIGPIGPINVPTPKLPPLEPEPLDANEPCPTDPAANAARFVYKLGRNVSQQAANVTAGAAGAVLMAPSNETAGALAALVPAAAATNGVGLAMQTGGALYLASRGEKGPARAVAVQLILTTVDDFAQVPDIGGGYDPIGDAMDELLKPNFGEESCKM